MKITALLTGRGNNTLKDKNILMLNGYPLLHYPANAAKKSKLISEFYVSSECKKILTEASECGYKKIVRPDALATPTALHHDVLKHAVQAMKEAGHTPDILVVLLANSPTVKSEWIDDCIQSLLNNDSLSSITPVVRDQDKHPYRAKTLSSDGKLTSFFDLSAQAAPSNRQQLPVCYFLCHNFWVIRLNQGGVLEDGELPWVFLGNNVMPYEVDESFDIHDMKDVRRASEWLDLNNINLRDANKE
jgi:CMP-N,N'-diacetyllegionaminic acid synthase